MVTYPAPICFGCTRFQEDRNCEPFPEGIPDEIWHSQHDHREPLGKEELLFDPEDEEAAEYASLIFDF